MPPRLNISTRRASARARGKQLILTRHVLLSRQLTSHQCLVLCSTDVLCFSLEYVLCSQRKLSSMTWYTQIIRVSFSANNVLGNFSDCIAIIKQVSRPGNAKCANTDMYHILCTSTVCQPFLGLRPHSPPMFIGSFRNH